MNLEELQEMSAKDLKIDDQQLDIESLKTLNSMANISKYLQDGTCY